ncbi:MAG: serine hydrolase [Planctomycetota bacterium]
MLIRLAAAVLTAAAAAASAGPTPTMPFSEAGYGEMMERWRAVAERFGVPGAAIALIKDGELVAIEGFGVREGEEPVDPDTMFYIASVTKTYVATAIVQLADRGRVDLDAPVRRYLPRFRLADSVATETITLRDLLSHAKGLNSGDAVLLDAYTGEITEDRYYRALRDSEPGGIEYTNVHYTILGRVIQAVTGQSWRDYLDEHVLEPAGLHRTTGYASEMYADANAAFPMVREGDGFVVADQVKTDAVMHAAGGMGASASDAARYLLMHLRDGEIGGTRIISASSAREMRGVTAAFDETQGRIRAMEGFGLAWFVGTWRGITPYLNHGGGYIGTAAHYSMLPEKGLGVVVLANASPAGQGLCDIVSIDVYERELEVEEPRDLVELYAERLAEIEAERADAVTRPRLSAADLSLPARAYAGRFVNPDLGTLTMGFDRGRLVGSLGMMRLDLSPGDSTDAFVVGSAWGEMRGRFEVENGRVTAIELTLDDDDEASSFERE